ncbi:MAG TPA: oxaloacetate decarboxylase gamma chain [Pasteurellaceae bacterium]|nr:oxaloacetate decarboxylase gamma chain [Pasteurellaceae bacterium]
MTETQLFLEGVNLALSGMGFVLVFLLILIWAISLMSNMINRIFPEPVKSFPPKVQQTTSPDDLEHLRPVIVAAISHHRRSQGLD